jgi:hypothetical protein
MRRAATLNALHRTAVAVALIGAACGPLAAAAVDDVAAVLDELHAAAAAADEARYFAVFAPEGVFLGTDAGERWTVEQFREYARPHFSRGRGWTYVAREGDRHIVLLPGGDAAWFDELLDNAKYGVCRGSGVLRKVDGAWKIAQYNLTIPIPNELASDVVRMIRGLGEAEPAD